MSDDFEERLKRAAKIHAAKSDANGRAKKVQEEREAAFLVRFYDLSRNVIEPELERAKQHIEAPGKVNARVSQSDDENEISLVLTDGGRKQISVLVFVADPLLVRVRVHSTVQIPMHVDHVSGLQDAMHGTGETPLRITMTLEEVTRDGIRIYVVEFAERALA
jgi:hypothetical protein